MADQTTRLSTHELTVSRKGVDDNYVRQLLFSGGFEHKGSSNARFWTELVVYQPTQAADILCEDVRTPWLLQAVTVEQERKAESLEDTTFWRFTCGGSGCSLVFCPAFSRGDVFQPLGAVRRGLCNPSGGSLRLRLLPSCSCRTICLGTDLGSAFFRLPCGLRFSLTRTGTLRSSASLSFRDHCPTWLVEDR